MSNEKTGVYQKYLNSLKEGDKVQAQCLVNFYGYNSLGTVLNFHITLTDESNIYGISNLNGFDMFSHFLKDSGMDILGGLQIVVPVEFVNQHL